MKKLLLIIAISLTVFSLSSQEPACRFAVSSGGYLPAYPDYDYNSPVYGINLQIDCMNIFENYGIGGEGFFSYSSYHDYFKEMNTYEVYLHNISGYVDKESKFAYGVFAGARLTEIFYEHRKLEYNIKDEFTRFVVGFKYLSNNWGGTLRWTQNRKNNSKIEYEVKFNNNFGWIIQLGGSLKGPVEGVKSDFHIYAGYEFYL